MHLLVKLPLVPAFFRDQSLAAEASILSVLEELMAVYADAHWCGYDVNLHRV